MYVILVTLLASLISGAATAMPQIRHGQVLIKDDPGGEIYAFADRWDQIKAKGVPVKIDGRCSSSCTMGLSNPNVCVTPRAQFDFHLAYTTAMHKTKDGRWIEGRSYWDRKASEQILRPRYPAWVKAWLTAHGGLSSQMKTMPYSYAKRFIRTCRSGDAMTALGHEQTYRQVRAMSVIPLKADIRQRGLHVRLVPSPDVIKRSCRRHPW